MTKESYSKSALNAMHRYGFENTGVERWENYLCRSQGKIEKNGLSRDSRLNYPQQKYPQP